MANDKDDPVRKEYDRRPRQHDHLRPQPGSVAIKQNSAPGRGKSKSRVIENQTEQPADAEQRRHASPFRVADLECAHGQRRARRQNDGF